MGQRFSGSARGKVTCRPPLSMAFKFLIAALALASSEAARQLRGDSPRDSRSLTNTFPFNANQGEEGHHHHGHHENSLRASSDIASRDQRQRGGDVPVDFGAVAAARPGQDGKRCIDKVEMVEETEYDDVVQCDHSYDRRCHTTYVTNYESQQEEDCEENFRKNCFIENEQIAFKGVQGHTQPEVHNRVPEELQPGVHHRALRGECEDVCEETPVENCRTEFDQQCTDVQKEVCSDIPSQQCKDVPSQQCNKIAKQVCDDIPTTKCEDIPRTVQRQETDTVCSDSQRVECKQVPRQVCNDIQVPRQVCSDTPKEFCQDVPRHNCRQVPREQCHDVPQQKCNFIPKEITRTVTEQKCQTSQREVCRTVPRQECRQVQDTKQECRDVQKQVESFTNQRTCNTVYEQSCH